VKSKNSLLTQAVKAEAHRLGFELVGVTSPDPPPHLDTFERWLADGRQATMGYLATPRARERRADPRQILPECETILCLGLRYDAPMDAQGLIAAYAWGDDYHNVLKPRLKALVSFIEGEAGTDVPNRWYTDTGPILERDLAERAGLGWIGKNSCLINPEHGSYFLLAEIFLGLALELDRPVEIDHCGSCTRCIEACPTDCILPDRTLDARNCISYLTIEHKGPLPMHLRSAIDDWIFGCDICQQVCPWNERFARPSGDPAFSPRPGLPALTLADELALDTQAFNLKFKGSPLKRTKRRGYLRNIAVALGNRADPNDIPALTQSLTGDPEPLVRGHAAWALGKMNSGPAKLILQRALAAEQDLYVRSEIESALPPSQ
jgi:epoxyqueuosine reductase